MFTNKHGGSVYAHGKDGGAAQLEINESGGVMSLFNKAAENVLQASVADTGEGGIETRDKHGYRTGRLP